ncbi:MAG TPA: site-2 protease family protein [Candidatus Limnocylindrales bacterium]|nr:site-2 protease family protein [Candidatus Limnocylindrales bacterium]
MLRGSIRLFRIAGIDVAIHPSWLIIFALVTWSLAIHYFPEAVPGTRRGSPAAWALGLVAAILLFGSVLVHELAHSLVARARGLDARSITLFIFGGVSNLAAEAPRPSTEFLVAIVGPLTSFALAGIAFLLANVIVDPGLEAVFGYLAIVNALLGGFNLIPGFPLDGGRVLRALVWNVTDSLRRATEIAVAVGKLVAYAFFVWGFVRVLGGDLFGGIWIAAIGWFLDSAASASLEQVRIDQRLGTLRVADVVVRDPIAVAPDTTVDRLIDDFLLRYNRRAMPVVENGRVVGIVTIRDIQEVPPERRATTTVGEVMGGRDRLVVLRPSDSLKRAFEALGEGDFEQVPVVDEHGLVGMLTRADLVRQIQLREALDVRPAATPAR